MTSFTVAIPTHDRRETVILAAQSAARQSRAPLEVLVLCDGCTDGTSAAIAALGDPLIRAIDLPKGEGYAYAHRNVALQQGRGDVVTWLGDDDLLLPGHLEQIGRLWDTAAFDLVTAPAVIVHEDDRLEWIGRDWRHAEHRRVLFDEGNTAVMASVSVRRQLASRLGGWDGAVPRAADWELWRRLLDGGARPAATHEATVLHFRATTREQGWPDRVRQNSAWFAELGDPARQAALADELWAARSGFEAALSARLHAVTTAFDETHDRLVALSTEYGADRAGLVAGRGAAEREARSQQASASAAHGEVARLSAELTRVHAEVARLVAEVGRARDGA